MPECVVAVEEPLLVPLFNSRGKPWKNRSWPYQTWSLATKGELTVTEFKDQWPPLRRVGSGGFFAGKLLRSCSPRPL